MPRQTMISWIPDRIRKATHPDRRSPTKDAVQCCMGGKIRINSNSSEMDAR